MRLLLPHTESDAMPSIPPPTGIQTSLAAFFAIATSTYNMLLDKVPESIHSAMVVATCLFVVDFITGTLTAFITGKYRSNTSRRMFFAKSVQYASIGAVVCCAAFVAGAPSLISVFLYIVSSIEAASILENAVKLERYGVPLGPLKPFVERISKYFAVAGDSSAIAIATTSKTEVTTMTDANGAMVATVAKAETTTVATGANPTTPQEPTPASIATPTPAPAPSATTVTEEVI